MNVVRFARPMSLALVCLVFLFTFSALSIEALAQDGIWDKTKQGVKKGAEGVKKGAETVGEKTKEGAEAVGHGVKDVFTDDDDDANREKAREAETQRPSTRPSDTTSPADTSSPSTMDTDSRSADAREMPATAGHLPLLALAGALAFAGAAISKVLRGV